MNKQERNNNLVKMVGFLIPSTNISLEPEAYRILPPNYTAHFHRLRYEEPTRDSYERMLVEIPTAVQYLADAHVDVIGYACTTGSMYRGPGFDVRLSEEIERLTGIRATTAGTAVVEALNCLKAKKLAVVTPYHDWVNELLISFLKAGGFEVSTISRINPNHSRPGTINSRSVLEAGLILKNGVHDTIFISCTGLRTLDVLQELEDAVGKPVVSSNQAIFWKILGMFGDVETISGYGKLLESRLSEDRF